MQALQVVKFGEFPQICEIETPRPASHQVLLRIEACGLNFADLLMIKGTYQDTPPPPFTLGLELSGEIIEFSVTPMAATAEIKAAQNRLTMAVMVSYENVLNEDDNLEKRFSFYFDFPGNLQVFDVKDAAIKDIFDRITQDIFNETLAKW